MRITFGVIIMSLFFVNIANCEHLVIIEQDSLELEQKDFNRPKEHWEHKISAFIEDDITLVGTVAGLYSKSVLSGEWRKALDCQSRGDSWWTDKERAKKNNAIFYPAYISRFSSGKNIVIYDKWIQSIYLYDYLSDSLAITYVETFGKILNDTYVSNINIYDDHIIVSKNNSNNKISEIALMPSDLSNYNMIFESPVELMNRFRGVLIGTLNCVPTYVSTDSTIWSAFFAYNYIYIINFQGQLIDSILIDRGDFILPQPPVSHVKTKAVVLDWRSKFTPVTSILYTSPGYVVLQYNVQWEQSTNDSIPLFTTVVFDSQNRKPVDLDIDKSWQVAGVQPDGRIIFAATLIQDGRYFLKLYVARIVP